MYIFIFVRCRVRVIIREKFVFKIKFFFLLDWVNFDDVAIEFVFVVMDILFWNQFFIFVEVLLSSEKTEKWVDFSNKILQDEEVKDNWVDFNDIKDLVR